MVASIRNSCGRMLNPRAGLDEAIAAMKPGVKIAAVLMSGKGRLIQGRVSAIEGGKIVLDNESELIDPRDVCSIKLTDGVANNDRKTETE